MIPFRYVEAGTVAQAAGLMDDGQANAQVIAGGTDVLGEIKDGLIQPATLVSLRTLSELRGIALSPEGLYIGAMTSVAEVESHPEIASSFRALAQAAAAIATPQIRNAGTVGGNLCQRPRCWFYRNPLLQCRKRGGDDCFAFETHNKYHAIIGGSTCRIVHPSDLAVALIAHGARISLAGRNQRRSMPIGEFFKGPEVDVKSENALIQGEIVTEVFVPQSDENQRSVFLKAKERQAMDFALASVAVSLEVTRGTIRAARIALGGVAPVPLRVPLAEQVLIGRHVGGVNPDLVGRQALEGAEPLSENAYKVRLCSALVSRAVKSLLRDGWK